MGYGGALIWTGLARNLKEKFPEKKVVFVYKRSPKMLFKKHPDHIIFQNNPDIEKVLSKLSYFFLRPLKPKSWLVVDMDKKEAAYWKEEGRAENKIFLKDVGKHAIQIACDYFGIGKAKLKPKVVFAGEEIKKAKEILERNHLLEKRFIVIEPNAKEDFSQTKRWPWENWQKLADSLKEKGISTAQVGVEGSPVLRGVVDLTGQTSFREAVALIAKAKVFVGIEGGLTHGSTAVGTKSVVLISGFVPKDLFSYPQNINIYKGSVCELSPCGLKRDCPYNIKCMVQIGVLEVEKAVLELWNS